MKPSRAFLFFLCVLLLFIIASLSIYGDWEHVDFSVRTNKDIGPPNDHKKQEMPKEVKSPKSTIPLSQITPPSDESISTKEVSIEFSGNDQKRLKYLQEKLNTSPPEDQPIHILYFGDSQLEGDRITSSIRKELQKRWGGSGPGLIPADQYYNSNHQLIITLSQNLEVQSFLDNSYINKSITFKNTIIRDTEEEAWIRIARIQSLNPGADYSQLHIFYTSSDTCLFNAEESGNPIYKKKILPTSETKNISLSFDTTPSVLRLKFKSKESFSIAGISLESSSGIMVDNIALRGKSYPDFLKSDQSQLSKMISDLNPGLFILHYGINLVPYIQSDYTYYKNQYIRQIQFLRREFPEVPILIIGVSDMARSINGGLSSYPNIEQIKKIQKEVAFETQSAFWDLEGFMGGTGSIIKWKAQNPPLASSDYIHFTKDGANLVGKEIAKQLIKELEEIENIAWLTN